MSADLDESDTSKAVIRQRVDLPRSEAEDDGLPPSLAKSRDVRRRLQRLAGKFNQQLADQQAEFQRQISGLTQEVQSLRAARGEATSTDEAEHERVMADFQRQFEEAAERGDSKTQAEISRKMATEVGRFMHAQTQKQLGTIAGKEAGAGGKPAGKDGAGAGRVTAAGRRWLDAQEEWFEDEDYGPERAAVVAMHQQLLEEGMDPETDDLYSELERRVAKRFQHVPLVRTAKAKPSREFARPADDGAPIQPQPAGGMEPGRRRATLTPAQRATMLAIGQDPNNDSHVLNYLREARALADAE